MLVRYTALTENWTVLKNVDSMSCVDLPANKQIGSRHELHGYTVDSTVTVALVGLDVDGTGMAWLDPFSPVEQSAVYGHTARG